MKYPIKKLDKIIDKIHSNYSDFEKRDTSPEMGFDVPLEERVKNSQKSFGDFMAKMRVEVQPDAQKILSEIETKLENEEVRIANQVRPILDEAKSYAEHPTNPLGYNRLAALLSELKGRLEFSKQKPKITLMKLGSYASIVGVILFVVYTILIPTIYEESDDQGQFKSFVDRIEILETELSKKTNPPLISAPRSKNWHFEGFTYIGSGPLIDAPDSENFTWNDIEAIQTEKNVSELESALIVLKIELQKDPLDESRLASILNYIMNGIYEHDDPILNEIKQLVEDLVLEIDGIKMIILPS